MSVHNLSRFAAHLALDYKKLRAYQADPENFLPSGETEEETRAKITNACGGLTDEEIALIRKGNWRRIMGYIADQGPRPMGEDQGEYP